METRIDNFEELNVSARFEGWEEMPGFEERKVHLRETTIRIGRFSCLGVGYETNIL
jgi:hypothetical protein